MATPKIHGVTTAGNVPGEKEPALLPDKKKPATDAGITSSGGNNAIAVTLRDVDIDEIDDTPSVIEFKKLRKVMGQITAFYRRGSEMKWKKVEAIDVEIAKVAVDQDMVEAQLGALQPQDMDGVREGQFLAHPKAAEYRKNLSQEKAGLVETRSAYEAQRKEAADLHEWSLGVVACCEWLESFLLHYCKQKLDLPARLCKLIGEPRELSSDEKDQFSKALDEITFNLAESQDFFQASVDGRLKQYHQIELDIIQAQMGALKSFPDDNPRKQYIQNELDKDLQYLAGNMKETPEGFQRKQQMLDNHKDFFKALRYPRDKLKLLLVDADAALDRVYDSQYDLYPADENSQED